MHLLILAYNYHPEPIGIAPLVTELAEGLVQRGHQVTVITAFPNYPERRIYAGYQGRWQTTSYEQGVRVIRHWIYVRPQPGLITRLLLELSTILACTWAAVFQPKADLVLTVSPPLSGSLVAALLKQLWDCPVVLNIQDLLPDAGIAVGLIKNPLLIKIFRWLERFAYANAQSIAVISPGFTQNLLAKGIAHTKITEIANWVDTNFFRPLPKENAFRQEHGLTGKFVGLYSGNIALTQGLEHLLQTAQTLLAQPQFQFVIIGPEQGLAPLKELAAKLHLTNVTLLPFQPRARLPEVLAAADYTLVLQRGHVVDINMPSKIPVLLAAGRPVVAAVNPKGSAAQVLRHSGGGVLLPPDDPQSLSQALQALAQDPLAQARYGERARAFALQTFSRSQALSAYEQLFQEMVLHKPRLQEVDG